MTGRCRDPLTTWHATTPETGATLNEWIYDPGRTLANGDLLRIEAITRMA